MSSVHQAACLRFLAPLRRSLRVPRRSAGQAAARVPPATRSSTPRRQPRSLPPPPPRATDTALSARDYLLLPRRSYPLPAGAWKHKRTFKSGCSSSALSHSSLALSPPQATRAARFALHSRFKLWNTNEARNSELLRTRIFMRISDSYLKQAPQNNSAIITHEHGRTLQSVSCLAGYSEAIRVCGVHRLFMFLFCVSRGRWVPGPIAKTSFGHKMAEAGGDPGGLLPCRLVSHATSIHPLSR